MAQVATCNVIEYLDGTILAVSSFLDDDEAAEALFTQLAKENDFSDEQIEVGLDDGILEQGNYQLFLTHSSGKLV